MSRFVLILTSLGFLLFLSGCTDKEPAKSKLLLETQNFSHSVDVLGEVLSRSERNLTCPDGIRGFIDWIAESGSQVETGEVVVKITDNRLSRGAKDKERSIKYANRRLTREKRKIEKESLELELKVLEKQYELATKELELEFKFGEKDERVLKALDLKIQLLDEKIVVQTRKLDSYKILESQNSVSKEEMERLKKNLQTLKIDRSLEQLERRIKVEGVTGLEKEKLLLEKDMLVRELQDLAKEKEEKEKSFPLRLQKLELEIEKRKKQLTKLEESLKKSEIKSEISGTFMRVKHPWNGTVMKEGVSVRSRRSVGKIMDFNSLKARFQVSEKYVDLIKEGANIHFEGLRNPGKRITGKVAKVDSMASKYDPSNTKSSKFHWVHVDFEAPENSFIPGETLTGTIEIQNFEDVFLIPREIAILSDNKKKLTISGLKELSDDQFHLHEDFFIVPSSTLTKSGSLEVPYAL